MEVVRFLADDESRGNQCCPQRRVRRADGYPAGIEEHRENEAEAIMAELVRTPGVGDGLRVLHILTAQGVAVELAQHRAHADATHSNVGLRRCTHSVRGNSRAAHCSSPATIARSTDN